MKRLIAVIAGVAMVALVAAGCGSSSDSSTASLTKAEFLKQGNAICAAGSKEINTGFEEAFPKGKEPSKAEVEEAAETVLIPSVSKQINEISELGFPEGEEETYETFIENAETALGEVEEDPSSISGKTEPFTEVNKEANEIGLSKCGE